MGLDRSLFVRNVGTNLVMSACVAGMFVASGEHLRSYQQYDGDTFCGIGYTLIKTLPYNAIISSLFFAVEPTRFLSPNRVTTCFSGVYASLALLVPPFFQIGMASIAFAGREN